MRPPPALGALLTGGESRRMGRDKATLELAGRTLAQRVSHTLAQLTTEVVQVGSAPVPGLKRRFIADLRAGCGPAAGIEAALADGDLPVVVLAVDLPLIPSALLLEALRAVDTGATICAPRFEHRWHPLCAAYAPAVLAALRTRLDAGELDLHGLLDQHATPLEGAALEAFGDPHELLVNINTPDDVARAAELLASRDNGGR